MAFIKWLLTFLMSCLILIFTLLNLQIIDVTWSPLHEAVSAPVYAVILVSLTIGFFWGGLLVWFNGHATRKDLKESRKTIKRLETKKELAEKESDITMLSHKEEI